MSYSTSLLARSMRRQKGYVPCTGSWEKSLARESLEAPEGRSACAELVLGGQTWLTSLTAPVAKEGRGVAEGSLDGPVSTRTVPVGRPGP